MKLALTILFSLISLCLKAQITETIELETESKDIPFAIIEEVPIYSGCNSNLNTINLKKCMSTSISKLVAKKFNTKLANTLNLPAGKVRIMAMFKINTLGDVDNIKARAVHPELEKEAIRVISLIPKLDKPGFVNGKPVNVSYTLPIIFNIEGKSNIIANRTFPLIRGCSSRMDTESLKICTEDKVNNFIKSSFNLDIARTNLPNKKTTKLLVSFNINKKGKVINVDAKAQNKAITKEAIRVTKKLPKFLKPGYNTKQKPIVTKYNLEITLNF